MSLNPGADCPGLEPGIRPDVSVPLATFRVAGDGRAFHVSPSSPRRASWATSLKKLGRLADPCDTSMVIRESRESQLAADIEAALVSGRGLDGYLSLTRTAVGIKAIPYRGKAFVVSDVRTLARLIDRDMVGFSALAQLGLAPSTPQPRITSVVQAQALASARPAKAAKKPWVKLTLGDLRHI